MDDSTTPSAASAPDLIRDPHGTYARLRASAPVCPVQGPNGSPAWLVTRYEDAAQALGDPRLSLDRRHAAPGTYQGFELPPALDRNLLNMDGPDHARVRRLAAGAFGTARAEQLRPATEKAAHALLDRVEGSETDLITSYAAPLPTLVICEVLGVPEEDRPDFRRWTEAMVAPDPANPDGVKQAIGGLYHYVRGLVAAKRADPRDDVLSDLVAAAESGDRLTEDELTSLAFLLLTAGFENTTLLIGNAVHALLTHPGQLRLLQRRPELLPQAVDELARFEGPAPVAIRRFATEDLKLGGVTVPAGATVLVGLASADRDAGHFADPDTLDLERADRSHLALGRGPHYCLGAPLARVETETALGTLLSRFPDLTLAAPAESLPWRTSTRSRGLRCLPVRLHGGGDPQAGER